MEISNKALATIQKAWPIGKRVEFGAHQKIMRGTIDGYSEILLELQPYYTLLVIDDENGMEWSVPAHTARALKKEEA